MVASFRALAGTCWQCATARLCRRVAGHRSDKNRAVACRACRRSSPAVASVPPTTAGASVGKVVMYVVACRVPHQCRPCWVSSGKLIIDLAAYYGPTAPRAARGGVLSIVAGQGPGCRGVGWSSAWWRAVDRRRAGHRPGNVSRAFPAAVPPVVSIDRATVPRAARGGVLSIVAGLVIDRATCRGPSPRPCRPWCRSTGQRSPRAARGGVLSIVAGQGPGCRGVGWLSTGPRATAPRGQRVTVPPVVPMAADLSRPQRFR